MILNVLPNGRILQHAKFGCFGSLVNQFFSFPFGFFSFPSGFFSFPYGKFSFQLSTGLSPKKSLLFGGALHRAVGAEHAAVALFRKKRLLAFFAGVVDQANIGGHGFHFPVSALGAGNF